MSEINPQEREVPHVVFEVIVEVVPIMWRAQNGFCRPHCCRVVAADGEDGLRCDPVDFAGTTLRVDI